MKEEKRNKRQHKSWELLDSYSEVLVGQKTTKQLNKNVSYKSERGETPLTSAVWNRDIDRVVELLNLGVPVNELNISGHSPLAISIYTKQSKIVSLLKSNGEELVRKKDISLINDGLSELDEDLLDYALKNGCDVNFCDPKGRLPLVEAVKSINITKVNLLLKYQADTNKGDLDSVFPLKQAVDVSNNYYRKINARATSTIRDSQQLKYENTVKIAEIILKQGGKLMAHYITEAIRTNNDPLLKLLFSYGSEVNQSTWTNYNTIIKSISSSSTHIFNTLIAAGVDINVVDCNGRLALCEAVVMGNKDALESLIQMGADCNIVDRKYKTAFVTALCLKKDRFEFAKRMILEGNVHFDYQLSISFRYLPIRRFEYLLKLGADPFKKLENGEVVITDIVVLLIQRHAPLNTHTFLFSGKWIALLRECGYITCHPETGNQLFYDLLTCRSFKKATAKFNAPLDELLQAWNSRNYVERYANYILNTIVQLMKLGTVVPSYDSFEILQCDETECICDFLKKDLGLEDKYNEKLLYHGVVKEPVSLQMQCRTAVRRAMRTNCVDKTKCLPLPDSIKKFLTFDGEIVLLNDLFDGENR